LADQELGKILVIGHQTAHDFSPVYRTGNELNVKGGGKKSMNELLSLSTQQPFLFTGRLNVRGPNAGKSDYYAFRRTSIRLLIRKLALVTIGTAFVNERRKGPCLRESGSFWEWYYAIRVHIGG
jgi:hypothetical protein